MLCFKYGTAQMFFLHTAKGVEFQSGDVFTILLEVFTIVSDLD